ncbi:MAG: DnaJ domain-containing protein [Deltaproteobacteria bacterium]|nr:DnaJ domain-containing protein [Deltaproteobacteria bacterium]
MVELANGNKGRLGRDLYYSDLFGEALRIRFDGCIRLLLPGGEVATFFREGAPVQVVGPGLAQDFLGEILVENGVITGEQLEAVREAQGDGPGRALIGALLREHSRVSSAAIQDAMRKQTARRVTQLFSLTSGEYQIEARPVPELAEIAVPVDGFPLLLFSLKHHASDQELRDVSDSLLGNAVVLQISLKQIEQFAPSEEDRKILAYVDRPRKTQHLELTAESRRECRALLKTLLLFRFIGVQPARAGIPIKEATRVVAPATALVSRRESSTSGSAPGPSTSSETANTPIPRAGTPAPRAAAKPESAAVKDLRALAEQLPTMDHFQLLGIKETVEDPADLRLAFTVMAKKFHPDTLGGDLSEEVQEIARAVASSLNEAYNTLSDPERRKKYLLSRDQGTSKSGLSDDQLTARAGAARVKYEMAQVFLRKRDYKKARETLRFAIDLAPKVGLFKGALAWAMFTDPQYNREEAIDKGLLLLEEAVELAPREADLRYWQGRFLKEMGDEEAAVECFRKALKIDERHVEAERELRVVDLRNKKDRGEREKSSPFSRLFKR